MRVESTIVNVEVTDGRTKSGKGMRQVRVYYVVDDQGKAIYGGDEWTSSTKCQGFIDGYNAAVGQ